jgi:hypothetical protein
MMKHSKNTTTLYDIGGMFLVWLFFGLPLGIIFDYLWNLLVLSLALPRLLRGISSNPSTKSIRRGRRFAYCFFITLLGVVIDWAYLELTWDVEFNATLWAPAMGMPLQLVLLIVPMMMLWLVNFALSYSYLRLERRQAIILGGIMAFFTAPWLLPTMPYVLGWAA